MNEYQGYYYPEDREDATDDANAELHERLVLILQKVAMAELLTMAEMKLLCFGCGIQMRDVT